MIPLVALAVLLSSTNVVPSPDVTDVGYETAVNTRVFEVLDMNLERGVIVFRHVYTLAADEERGRAAGIDCAYDGLGAFEGENIGVYDVIKDDYAIVFSPRPAAVVKEDCADDGEQQSISNALSAHLDAQNLRLDARPTGVGPAKNGTSFIVTVDDKPGVIRSETRRATSAEIKDALSTRDGERVGAPSTDASPSSTESKTGANSSTKKWALAQLWKGELLLHQRLQPITDDRDVGREFDVLALFVDGHRAVALERFSHRPPGGTARTLFRFSPVVDVSGAPDVASEPPSSLSASPSSDTEASDLCSTFLGCGACTCALPLLAGCGCVSCCNDVCGPNAWREFLDDEIEESTPEQAPPPSEDPPHQIIKMRY